ncbi:PREDICTED: uncharacterized protein LOC106124679 [Papilio xuthus]|uniref:Uncharacterized protein LOC106124679 n=1 Tax=Papilio xuthus TaxID=66420 RepID=A0AAJ6ZPY8_PAPXU|nr:PREDICTED: uncharacterized protein LOC106124679 [Papilio xuthus]
MDTDDYNEITSQLDAREILRYLNHLGIHNISGEVLKYFITDLKKLIKYDLQHKHESENTKSPLNLGTERLHSASTFSSRARSRATTSDIIICCSKQSQKPKKLLDLRNVHSAPNLFQAKEEVTLSKKACSCEREVKKSDILSKDSKTTPSINSNFIRKPKEPVKRKHDPVSLYHYYSSLWEKYKPNVPGENNWSELRWSIRQKMAGSAASQSSKNSVHTRPLIQSKKLK